MDPLKMFVPLAKADAAQRLVYGYFDETPDRSGEVFDYASSKPLIEAWSGEIAKASEGKSFGNVRAQHGRNAAGKLTEISFDDDMKKVGFVAKIVDDEEWKKVEEGVYTGFSPGGRYAKRWQDGGHKRYTADVRELSIVDVPCNPAATFTMVKADGAEEERAFALDKAYEPGNEATVARAGEMAKAAGKEGRYKDFLVKARADLIAENADTALAKMASEEGAKAEDKPDLVAALDAALAKADGAAKKPYGDVKYADPDNSKYPIDTAAHIRAAWSYINMPKNQKGMDAAAVKAIKNRIVAAWKDKIDAKGPPSAEKMEAMGDLAKSARALDAIASSVTDQPILAKGLYTVQRVARLLECAGDITQSVSWEESAERDETSQLPKMAADIVASIHTFLVEMADEEVAELLVAIQQSVPDLDLNIVGDGDDGGDDEDDVVVMELAAKIVDLTKADTALMEKTGARNSRSDQATIQAVHDNAVKLGATCDTSAEKDALAEITADRDRLAKAFDAAVPKVEALAGKLETLSSAHIATQDALTKALGRIEELERQPMPPKGALRAMEKAQDGSGEEPLSKSRIEAIRAMPNGPAKAAALIQYAGSPGGI